MPDKIEDFFSNLLSKDKQRLEQLWSDAVSGEVKLKHGLADLKEQAQASFEHWLSNPATVRALFEGLREVKPNLAVHGLAIVTKHADVLEVLSHDQDFTVRQIYAAKMERNSGPFFLGMDRGDQYEHEHTLLRMATDPVRDLPAIREIVQRNAAELIDAAKPGGRIDAVNGLARLIATRVVEEYFGVPGPDEPTMMRWHRAIFQDIFLNLKDDPAVVARAGAAAKEMNGYTAEFFARRKAELAAGAKGDDFLSRLLRMQNDPATSFDDAGIQRNVNGTILGAIETTSKAASQALDQLLSRPRELAAAQEAALADDDRLVSSYVFEALRFNPHNPILLRHCERAYTVASGTNRQTLIPEGSLVFVGTLAAMFDPDEFQNPNDFRVDRPIDKYIHFGHGLHTCFGEYINLVQVPEILKCLLRLKGLRRAAGPDGVMTLDGSFPDRLIVEFDA